MKSVVFALIALVSTVSLTAAALAATVNTTSGQVLINRGNGYTQVAGATQGNAGHTVMARPGGSGSIVYPDGCVVDVSPNAVVTISAVSPCATGFGPNATTFAIGAAVVGIGVGAAILIGKDKSASPEPEVAQT